MPQPAAIGGDVEIVEPYTDMYSREDGVDVETIRADLRKGLETLPCIKPYRVRVNGADVGLLDKRNPPKLNLPETDEDGYSLTPVSLTLTLLPKSVTIKAE